MPRRKRHTHLISILVPIGGEDRFRAADWHWLRTYYESHLGYEVEIVVGRDRSSRQRRWRDRRPFSKTTAINNAFKRSRGDIIVILDSDCYINASVILHCADRIRKARERDIKLWFIPYHDLYRLTAEATCDLLDSDPCRPLEFSDPPPAEDIDGTYGSGPSNGRDYGAMVMIMPRSAFECVGGMDPRFRGWGGDDGSFVHALDALWSWPNGHKNTPNDILHLWHPKFDAPEVAETAPWRTRVWANQQTPGTNDWLAMCYVAASKSPKSMRKLVDDGLKRKP